MALFFRGKTPCSLCGEVLGLDDQLVGFQAFLPPEHHLWRYSDSAMHAACFQAWPDKDEFDALYAAAQEEWRALRTPERIEERRRATEEARQARVRLDAEYNARHARIMATVAAHGGACPHCGTRSTSYRELSGTARLRLACLGCGRSCNADELAIGKPG